MQGIYKNSLPPPTEKKKNISKESQLPSSNLVAMLCTREEKTFSLLSKETKKKWAKIETRQKDTTFSIKSRTFILLWLFEK